MTLAVIFAHAFGGRADLPLPAWMFGYGAAAAVLISFAALAVFWPTARLEETPPGLVVARAGDRWVRVLSGAARVLGLALFAMVLVAAAIGDNSSRTNISPGAVYVVFWVGMIFVSGLVGDLWRVLSPFDTLAATAQRLRSHRPPADGPRGDAGEDEPGGDAGDPDEEDAGDGWGYWPAALGLLGFVWVELVYPDRAEPRALFVLMAAYTVVVLACAARWGRSWLVKGETFTALFGVIAHMAPLHRAEDGTLRLRPPFVGLAQLDWDTGLEALVLVALGSTTYDGLSRTQWWLDQTGDLTGNAATLAATGGLLWAVAIVSLAYVAAMRGAARLVRESFDAHELRAAFVHSLVPIAFAYAVAHYFSLLVLEGQAVISLVSDPLGRGWDLLGTAGRAIDYTVVGPLAVAYVQCAAIVAGHVAGVVMAHDRALVLFDRRVATRSQYPLLAAMVLFTVGGLLLLLGG